MDKEQAREVLARAMRSYRAKSYGDLRGLIGRVDAQVIANPDGPDFQVEIEAFWDDRPDGSICVSGGIDDGGWSAFAPLGDNFIMAPNGSIVGD